jgi:type I restriction enzyme M protein
MLPQPAKRMGIMTDYLSETRTEDLARDLLVIRGWDVNRPPKGQTVRQNEYKSAPELKPIFKGRSKTGSGDALPDFLLLSRNTDLPRFVIEAKGNVKDIGVALTEATVHYGDACFDAGYPVLAAGVAGQAEEDFAVRVQKRVGSSWRDVVYEGVPISWLPTEPEVDILLSSTNLLELKPTVPSPEVLATKAEFMNRVLREASVRDGQRPTYIGALMLAMWKAGNSIRKTDSKWVLKDVNAACQLAFKEAGKPDLAESLHIDEGNDTLARTIPLIIAELEKLNVVSASFSHDYLGQLYEAFFRYTGGNTIGQYFTPRHITKFMADICEVTKNDIVIDPTCGTGGFLIAALNRAQEVGHLKYQDAVEVVKHNLIGYESEPATAALSVANMILRGDGQSGIRQGDVLRAKDYPIDFCDVGLMNPPFPHRKTDQPVQRFVERALEAIKPHGKLAILMPTSLLAKAPIGAWREKILRNNTLLAVIQLSDELFQPYAAATTSVVLLEKGVAHSDKKRTVFVRIKHDGLTLRKGTRVDDDVFASQLPAAVDAVLNKTELAGFSGLSAVSGRDEWTVGAYIASAPPEENELKLSVDELMRRLFSFYVRYAQEVATQRNAVADVRLSPIPYADMLTKARIANSDALPDQANTVGGAFRIFYGQKELHSREGIAPGETLVISPTESYNGTYGWLNFASVLEPGFVTVAQTGSIGEAFVQLEPCAVNDDCLVLIPREMSPTRDAELLIAAATIRLEKWRFNYGRKLTPSRIAEFPFIYPAELLIWVDAELSKWKSIAEQAVGVYDHADESYGGILEESS